MHRRQESQGQAEVRESQSASHSARAGPCNWLQRAHPHPLNHSSPTRSAYSLHSPTHSNATLLLLLRVRVRMRRFNLQINANSYDRQHPLQGPLSVFLFPGSHFPFPPSSSTTDPVFSSFRIRQPNQQAPLALEAEAVAL